MPSPPAHRPLSRIAAAARRLARTGGLQHCPACRETFVCPVDWETDGEEHWLIQLRCGACETGREVRLTNVEAKTFDLELDRQTAKIARALERIDRERMQTEVDAFVMALEHDLIDAADFAA